jgi:hypothetical protein
MPTAAIVFLVLMCVWLIAVGAVFLTLALIHESKKARERAEVWREVMRERGRRW